MFAQSVSGARVSLSWHEEGAVQPRSIQVSTGPDGWYRSCATPADVPVLLSADYYGRQGPRREITVGQDGFTNAAVNLFELQPSRISGHLKDRDTGNGVEGAETWLRGTDFRTLTNGRGDFVFNAVPSGTYMLMTDHLAYGAKMDTLIIPGGQRLAVEMLLDNRPIEIAPLRRRNEDIPTYNAAARKLAEAQGIQVNDLYSAVEKAGTTKLIGPDGVHFNGTGNKVLGTAVAAFVQRAWMHSPLSLP